MRPVGAAALHLLLLLSSLLDAAGHELLCRDEPAPSRVADGSPSSGAQILPTEEGPDRDCPCCRLNGPRSWLAPPSTTDPALALAEVATARPGVPFLKPFPTSHPSRGPPVC